MREAGGHDRGLGLLGRLGAKGEAEGPWGRPPSLKIAFTAYDSRTLL